MAEDDDDFTSNSLWSLLGCQNANGDSGSGSDDDFCSAHGHDSGLSQSTSDENCTKARPTVAPRLLEQWCDSEREEKPAPKKMPAKRSNEPWEWASPGKRQKCNEAPCPPPPRQSIPSRTPRPPSSPPPPSLILQREDKSALLLQPEDTHEETKSALLLEGMRLATLQHKEDEKTGGHFDFIEVGTSDWGTITQYCAGFRGTESGFGGAMRVSSEAKAPPGSIVRADGRIFSPRGSIMQHLSKLAKVHKSSTATLTAEPTASKDSSCALQRRNRKPRAVPNRPNNARGLAVEAVNEHLGALPSLPHVTKVEAAMDERCGVGTLYCVSGQNIRRYMGCYHAKLPGAKRERDVDVMWYAKSLASLGSPQPELKEMLEQIGRLDLLEERQVRVLDWSELCRLYEVRSVDVVQLDCEGKDCAILRGLLSHCAGNPAAYPRLIMFESNHLTKKAEASETISALKQRGYRTLSRNRNNIVMERTWTP